MTLFWTPYEEMPEDELLKELAYWKLDETGEAGAQGYINEIENELKIRANLKTSGFKVTGVPRVQGEPDWYGTAMVGVLGATMMVMYGLMTLFFHP